MWPVVSDNCCPVTVRGFEMIHWTNIFYPAPCKLSCINLWKYKYATTNTHTHYIWYSSSTSTQTKQWHICFYVYSIPFLHYEQQRISVEHLLLRSCTPTEKPFTLHFKPNEYSADICQLCLGAKQSSWPVKRNEESAAYGCKKKNRAVNKRGLFFF